MFETTKLVDEPWKHDVGITTFGICPICRCTSIIEKGICTRRGCEVGYPPPPGPSYEDAQLEKNGLNQQFKDWWDEEFQRIIKLKACVLCGTNADPGSNYCSACFPIKGDF